MPNCFQFISKVSGEAEKLPDIDNKLCAFMGVEPSKTDYFLNWRNIQGYSAACGESFEKMKEEASKYYDEEEIPTVHKMIDWFDENYTIKWWFEMKW